MLPTPFADASFDLVGRSLAIHNIDGRDLPHHERRLQAISGAVLVLKTRCRLPIVDLLHIRHYADHLHDLRMQDMRYRRLGWRMW
jgi:hypothetical protein